MAFKRVIITRKDIGIPIQIPVSSFIRMTSRKPVSQHQTNVISVGVSVTSQTPTHLIQMKIPLISDQKVTQCIKVDSASHMKLQKVIDYARAQQIIPVVGHLHIDKHVAYWEERILASGLIINWLKNKIPLYPRNLIELSMRPDPLHYLLTEEQNL